MSLLTELIVFLRYRYYKDWARTERVLASAESSPQEITFFTSLLSLLCKSNWETRS
jgi:hypothetical protein